MTRGQLAAWLRSCANIARTPTNQSVPLKGREVVAEAYEECATELERLGAIADAADKYVVLSAEHCVAPECVGRNLCLGCDADAELARVVAERRVKWAGLALLTS